MGLTQITDPAARVADRGLSTIQSGRNYLDGLANKYIVKPKTVTGIGGFVFDYEGETRVSRQADITDHYSENNEFLNDHMAMRPFRLTLRGFVAELVFQKPAGILGALQTVQTRLGVVPAYLGKYTPQGLQKAQAVLTQATQVVNKVDQSLARIKNVVGLFKKGTQGPTRQQEAFRILETLQEKREIFLVETPYRIFDHMALEAIDFVQPEETRGMSDVVVTLKQMRFAEVITTTVSADILAERLASQAAATQDQGKSGGTPANQSILSNVGGKAADALKNLGILQ